MQGRLSVAEVVGSTSSDSFLVKSSSTLVFECIIIDFIKEIHFLSPVVTFVTLIFILAL